MILNLNFIKKNSILSYTINKIAKRMALTSAVSPIGATNFLENSWSTYLDSYIESTKFSLRKKKQTEIPSPIQIELPAAEKIEQKKTKLKKTSSNISKKKSLIKKKSKTSLKRNLFDFGFVESVGSVLL